MFFIIIFINAPPNRMPFMCVCVCVCAVALFIHFYCFIIFHTYTQYDVHCRRGCFTPLSLPCLNHYIAVIHLVNVIVLLYKDILSHYIYFIFYYIYEHRVNKISRKKLKEKKREFHNFFLRDLKLNQFFLLLKEKFHFFPCIFNITYQTQQT